MSVSPRFLDDCDLPKGHKEKRFLVILFPWLPALVTEELYTLQTVYAVQDSTRCRRNLPVRVVFVGLFMGRIKLSRVRSGRVGPGPTRESLKTS